eukprot:2210605-Karenia_brevis.AAC.1
MEMYKEATKEMYSFLSVNMLERDVSRMFFRKFSSRLMPRRIADEAMQSKPTDQFFSASGGVMTNAK